VWYAGPNDATASSANGTTGSYVALTPSWPGSAPDTVAGSLFALGVQRDSDLRVVSYDRFGTRPLTVTDMQVYGRADGSTPETNITLDSISQRTLTGSISAPPRPTQLSVGVRVGRLAPEMFDVLPGGSYSLVLPTGIPTRTTVELYWSRYGSFTFESGVARYHVSDATDVLDLEVPEPPTPILPVERAEGVDFETDFTWDHLPDAIATVTFTIAGWTIEATRAAASIRIPNLARYGVEFAPGDAGTWFVQDILGPSSTDDWLAMPPYYGDFGAKHVETYGLSRNFALAE
jgi:hypothetical protein